MRYFSEQFFKKTNSVHDKICFSNSIYATAERKKNVSERFHAIGKHPFIKVRMKLKIAGKKNCVAVVF